MTIELVQEAKKVLLMSWASRFGALAAVLQGLAEFQDQLPVIRDFVPHGVFSLLAIACAVAVPLSRIVKQQALIAATDPAPAATDPAAPPVDAPVAVAAAAVVHTAYTAPPPPPIPERVPFVAMPAVIESRPPPQQYVVIK